LIKDYNLKTTVHIAEVWNDPDLDFILKEVKPERIGHAVCLNKSYQAYLLSENRIPIEICPSSNLMTRLVDSIDNHPFLDFWGVDREYPLAICTDDRGMFNTSLTREQYLICSSFNFSIEDIFYLNKRAIKFIFDQSDVTLVQLKTKFDSYKNCFMQN
jgi:adenosine deaminase